MICIFKHKWIYSEKTKAVSEKGGESNVYQKRKCHKCGLTQENDGFFDTSYGWKNHWVNKWVTIYIPKVEK